MEFKEQLLLFWTSLFFVKTIYIYRRNDDSEKYYAFNGICYHEDFAEHIESYLRLRWKNKKYRFKELKKSL